MLHVAVSGGGAMDRVEQARAAAARYRQTASQREDIARRLDQGHAVADTLEQIEARAGRLVETGHVPASALLSAVRDERGGALSVLERIIGDHNDLQPVTFLTRGARIARTVGRISLDRGGRFIPFGTGFLVAPRLLLTNDHVLPDVATAAGSVVEFDCDPHAPAGAVVVVRLAPQELFVTDTHLDYCLVALEDLDDGRAPGEEFGWNPLLARQGKIVSGEPVNIIGHPLGRTKEVAVRNNHLSNQLDDFLHYATDTEPGNSGSPVFNDTWEVVALHHAGVPRTDDDGNVLRKDGQPWHRSDGDHTIDWVANEGTRVSVLLDHLAGHDLDETQRRTLATITGPAPADVGGPEVVAAPVRSDRGTSGVAGRVASVEAVGGTPGRATPNLPGASGAGAVLATGAQLVLLDGRSDPTRDPGRRRTAWVAALARGSVRAGLPVLGAEEAWFPVYGERLAALASARGAPGDEVAVAEALAPASPEARTLYGTILTKAPPAAGLPHEAAPAGDDPAGDDPARSPAGEDLPRSARWRRELGWLAARSRLDEVTIARTFRDVATYLEAPGVRAAVLDEVLTTVPTEGSVVLVGHGLGTVVGMDLLTRLPDAVQVVTLVTAGSPLGLEAVTSRLLVGGARLPGRVGSWVNAWCPADAVAVGCPLASTWGPQVTEVIAENPADRAHDIEEYLADGRVARAIGAALRIDEVPQDHAPGGGGGTTRTQRRGQDRSERGER
jgi:endonuclease G, mitochondrial